MFRGSPRLSEGPGTDVPPNVTSGGCLLMKKSTAIPNGVSERSAVHGPSSGGRDRPSRVKWSERSDEPASGVPMQTRPVIVPAALLVFVVGLGTAWGGISDVLRDPRFDRLGLAPIAPALASTVASTYPVASASSSVVYAYNPALDTLERQIGVAGPIIGERAETIGKGQFTFAASYSYVHLTSINGDDLGSLLNRPRVNGNTLIFKVDPG